MSAYSFLPPSNAGATAIRKVAHRILTKDYPLTGWLREITPTDAISLASEEIIKKLKKSGLRAAKRDKRAREGLPPKEKKKKKESPSKTPTDVEALDPVDEALVKLLPRSRGRTKKETLVKKMPADVEALDPIDTLIENAIKEPKKRRKKRASKSPSPDKI